MILVETNPFDVDSSLVISHTLPEPAESVNLQSSPVLLRTRKESKVPEFISELEDTTVDTGKPMKLTCSVVGIPRPKVTWSR